MAEEAKAEGVDFRNLKLRVGIFGAEPWSEAMRDEIEQKLNISAIDIYGLSEIMGPGVAIECIEAKKGLHIWEDHFIPEIINPDTGAVLPEGELGELVITTITKQGIPLIRYRTRDITSITYEPCVCGRTHARITRMSGRSDDMLIIRGVNVFPTQIEELLLKQEELAPQYEIEVTRDGNMDAVEVRVELAAKFAAIPEPRRQEVAKTLQHAIKTFVGISTRIHLMPPDGLVRSVGKARRVFDKRSKD
jgi:phenylacetate-CoA ligase